MPRVAALTLLTVLASCGQPAVEHLRPTRVEQDAATPLVAADNPASPDIRQAAVPGTAGPTQAVETAVASHPPAATVSAPGIDTAGIETTIHDVFGPTHGPRAVRVARCETGGWRPDVIYGPTTGKAGERGAYQAHPGHWRGDWGGPRRERVHGYTFDEMWSPEKATRWAFAHSKGGTDWSQWSCA